MKSLHFLHKYNLFFILIILSRLSYSQDAQKEALLLINLLEKNHYNAVSIDDQLSKNVFFQFIQSLDKRGLYFTKIEIKELSSFELTIDDELKGKSSAFLPVVTKVYKQRLIESEKILQEILEKPFDFTIKESITFNDSDTVNFTQDETALKARYKRYLKYKILIQLMGFYHDSIGSDQDKSILSKEEIVRKKVLLIERRNIKRILEHPDGFENYVLSQFLNSITHCFDPHSVYFSKTDWGNFQSELSTETLSYGMDLQENENGDIVIARLAPGGPAWKTSELHKGDILIALQWEGKEKVDLSGAEIYEIEKILESSNYSRLNLTVKLANGMLKSVVLVKEKIRKEDNIVKSYILNGTKKIGYISLPGFYTEWENTSSLGCANDVAKEIVKLKQENIEGLIVDIRYNGGGSLTEGLNLAGIFINEGPLFMMQEKDRKPYVRKDMNRGTIYDGPLALMINGQSASASEVLASTLQDFNRAILVGSTTYGKATGQLIMPLDTTVNPLTLDLKNSKSLSGAATITMSKLYRIKGNSAQAKGVQPDISLPDIYDDYIERELSYRTALVNDSVNKKVIYYPLPALPVSTLASLSKKRISEDMNFQHMSKVKNNFQNSIYSLKTLPLQYTSFRELYLKNRMDWILLEKDESISKNYEVENTSQDKYVFTIDDYGKEINTIVIKELQKDIHVQETYFIISDLINLTKK
jgi:carboxyl-terminal processing protease